MDRLSGKRALITGGTTGIGLETAQHFLREGARVAITGKNPATLESARKELGDGVLILSSDAGDPAAQEKVAEQIRGAFGALDILFLNAGIVDMKPLGEWDEAAFDRSFAINLKGPFFLLQALLPVLANPASIVLNGSVNAHIGMAGTSVYSATKGALITLARTISGELLPRGIRVNVVSAGPIAMPLHDKLGMSQEAAAALIRQVPAGRFGQPSEIASAVVFLASDESAFTVGSELLIDGGMSSI